MTEIDLLDSFAENVHYEMRRMGMDQSELARKSGVSRQAINRYLNRQRMPNLKSIVNICYALNCDYDDILPFLTSLVD